jgi:hypothetical protein
MERGQGSTDKPSLPGRPSLGPTRHPRPSSPRDPSGGKYPFVRVLGPDSGGVPGRSRPSAWLGSRPPPDRGPRAGGSPASHGRRSGADERRGSPRSSRRAVGGLCRQRGPVRRTTRSVRNGRGSPADGLPSRESGAQFFGVGRGRLAGGCERRNFPRTAPWAVATVGAWTATLFSVSERVVYGGSRGGFDRWLTLRLQFCEVRVPADVGDTRVREESGEVFNEVAEGASGPRLDWVASRPWRGRVEPSTSGVDRSSPGDTGGNAARRRSACASKTATGPRFLAVPACPPSIRGRAGSREGPSRDSPSR